MVTLTIDGKRVQAEKGMTILDAASHNGIHIPNLCYLKGYRGVGACRLCLVEIEGIKSPMIACVAKVKDGMVVHTKTEKVLEVRKFVIDLILSMHPLDCMTCTKAGVCTLQKYAYDLGIRESSFSRKKFGYPTDEANPFIKRDPEYCILCGRCVRVCANQGTHVLAFMGRGVGARVVTPEDRPLQESGCTFCGSCVDACPVNALLEADRWRKGREWEYERTATVCMLCGNACQITACTKDGAIAKIVAGGTEDSVEKYICAYGRFGFDSLGAASRIRIPLIRKEGGLHEATWEEAIAETARVIKEQGDNLGIVATATLLNEDALTLRELLAKALRKASLDTTASLYQRSGAFSLTSASVDDADLFVVIDLDPDQWLRVLPALDAIIRRRIAAGAKLVTIGEKMPRIGSVAALNFSRDVQDIVKALVKTLYEKSGKDPAADVGADVCGSGAGEDVVKAAELVLAARNPVIFTSGALYPLAVHVADVKGTVISVPLESNAKGVHLMGLTPKGRTYQELLNGGTGVLYAVGEVPHVARHKDTRALIVQQSHLTPLAEQADIVLPAASYLETEGSLVDFMGRLRLVRRVVSPPDEAKNHREIFVMLAHAIGGPISPAGIEEVQTQMERGRPRDQMPFAKIEGLGIEPRDFIESLNEPIIRGSRLLWLKESLRGG